MRALVLTLSLLLTAIAALVLLNAVTPWEAAYADAATKWLALKPMRGGPALTCVGCHE